MEQNDIEVMEAADQRDDAWAARKAFLGRYSCKEEDVLVDEDGDEFFYLEDESGSPGCDYSISTKKVYIPEELSFTY